MGTPEFVTSHAFEFVQVIGAVVGQGMSFEPGPQIFNRVEVRRISWQEFNADLPVQPVHILVHPFAVMRSQTVPDHQQGTFDLGSERFEKFDNLFFLDAAHTV